jgi:hypothetical protein
MPNPSFEEVSALFQQTFIGLFTNLANTVREKTNIPNTEKLTMGEITDIIRGIDQATITEDWPNITISSGLINSEILKTVPYGSVNISGNKVNVSEGYVNSETKTIPAGAVSVSGNKVNITEGYVAARN